MGETVTYRGPTDGTESDNYVVLPPVGEDGQPRVFPRNQPIDDVPDDIAKQLKGTRGEKFDFGSLDASPGEPYTGYDGLSADEVVKNLEASQDYDLAAKVGDYEADHKNRKTVIEAAKAQSAPEVTQGP